MKENFELLKALYCVHSKSGNEKKMRKFIKRWIKANVACASVVQDDAGNLYVTKGESESYPCLCAHMDQVQDLHSKDFVAVETDDIIFGWSRKTNSFQGLGADDKNGIWVALLCLEKYDIMKCAFFVGEEVGCVGSRQADMSFFDDCRYVVQIDRKGNSDLVTSIWDVLCSDDFLDDVDCEEWGYKFSDGLSTDVAQLRSNGLELSCVNMSCGYYEPHTDREYTKKADLVKCLRFVEHIVESCQKVYPFKNEPRVRSYGRGWGGYFGHGRTSRYDDWFMHDDEFNDASNELDGAVVDGAIRSRADFDQWVKDYGGYWTTMEKKDYEKLWSSVKDVVRQIVADEAELMAMEDAE